jgi:hypothetical protein
MHYPKNHILSMRLCAFLALGFPVDQAWDAVMGAGSYRKLSDNLHDMLNA